jgi:hypothetical protein
LRIKYGGFSSPVRAGVLHFEVFEMNSLIGKQLSVYDAAAVLNCGRDSVVRAIRFGARQE